MSRWMLISLCSLALAFSAYAQDDLDALLAGLGDEPAAAETVATAAPAEEAVEVLPAAEVLPVAEEAAPVEAAAEAVPAAEDPAEPNGVESPNRKRAQLANDPLVIMAAEIFNGEVGDIRIGPHSR